ncbi:hypothetical protein F5051DRAFT_434676, partial [Lentinula edodes]
YRNLAQLNCQEIYKLARQVLRDLINIDDPTEWQEFIVPAEELGLYLADPNVYALPTPPIKLDLSADTAPKMRHSPWNQMVISVLANEASERASLNPVYYGINEQTMDWCALFKERTSRIFLDVSKAKAGVKDYVYERKKAENRRRRSRQYKLDRRVQIASVMANLAHTLGNVEQYTCWAHILDSLNRLGVVGMSDDEETLDTQGQQGIIVYEPAFRNPGFNI